MSNFFHQSDFNITPEGEGNSLGGQPPIPLGGVVKMRLVPQIPGLNIPTGAQIVNQVSPAMIIKTYGLQAAQTAAIKSEVSTNERDVPEVARRSKLGTLIFSDLQFSPALNLPLHIPIDIALFSVTMNKNIIRTSIQGRDGQIKEYNGLDDFDINIKGMICGGNGNYPWDEVKNLIQYLKYNQSLGIVSKYLNELWDIHELVVKDATFEQNEGSYSFQKFEINCWSEKPIEVLIQEGNASA